MCVRIVIDRQHLGQYRSLVVPHRKNPLLLTVIKLKRREFLNLIARKYEKGETYAVAREIVMRENIESFRQLHGSEAARALEEEVFAFDMNELPSSSHLKHYRAAYAISYSEVDPVTAHNDNGDADVSWLSRLSSALKQERVLIGICFCFCVLIAIYAIVEPSPAAWGLAGAAFALSVSCIWAAGK